MNKTARVFLIGIVLLFLGLALLVVDNLPKPEKYIPQEDEMVVDNAEDVSLNDYKKEIKQLPEAEKNKIFEDEKLEGDVHRSVNEDEGAIIHYKKALEIKGDDKDVLYRLAIAQTSAGHYEDAELTYKKIEPMDSDVANFWFHRAGNIHKKPDSFKNVELAVQYAEKAYTLTQYKTDLFLISLLAESYFEQYKYYKMYKPDSEKISYISSQLQYAMDKWEYEANKQNNRPSMLQFKYIRDLIDAFPDGVKPNSPFNGELQQMSPEEKEVLKAKYRASFNKIDNYPKKDY